tara:strand:- start:690 stop:1412 length:723 start_codon:yes stop_codon:yes gene_type:complete
MPFYTVYVFDVDGTLTPSRDIIDSNFESFLLDWVTLRNVHLITGSDYEKTLEQIGSELAERVTAVHNCAGNSRWSRGEEMYRSEWTIPAEVRGWLEQKLEESTFPVRTGNHIEERCGLVNFSTIGRGASRAERKIYVKFDNFFKERQQLAKEFNEEFSGLEATIGGETGIDIYEKGHNKAQLLSYLEEVEEIHFFGDAIYEGGNDWPLAKAITARNHSGDSIYRVDGWQATYDILKQISN